MEDEVIAVTSSFGSLYGMPRARSSYDHAIDNLEYLLATPSFVSVPYLEVEQFPGNLDQHPRFQRLVTGVLAPPLS